MVDLKRLSEKWRATTSSPWFALLCAGLSFAVLLVLTGAFAGAALTKQPVRMDMTEVRSVSPRDRFQLFERDYDNDPIATLIEQTSHPEATDIGSATPPRRPEEVERDLRRLLLP
jgi:hypothetical protein